MAGIVPTVGKNSILDLLLNQVLTMKLYSNDITPSDSDTFATYNVVTGGGYADKSLIFGGWVIAGGIATYAQQEFDFTGATDVPDTIYGYYIVDGSNVLIGAERFADTVLPFAPVNGSEIKITPVLVIP